MTTYFSLLSIAFGIQPFVFHFVQVIIHILNALLVFIFFKKFFRQNIALLASLFFLIHPMNTETISYISITNDPLYFLFGMLGLLFLENNMLISGILLCISLFSKESGVLFVGISFLYCLFWKKENLKKFLAISAAALGLYCIVRFGFAHLAFTINGYFPMSRQSMITRLMGIPHIVVFYLFTYIFPVYLSTGRQTAMLFRSQGNWLSLLMVIIVGGLCYFIYRKNTKTHRQKIVTLFFIVWLCIGLAPYLQILSLNSAVAERWFYFAQIGFLGLVSIFITRITYRRYMVILAIIVLILFSLRTIIRNFDWKDDKTLFGHDVLISPNSYMVQTGIGLAYLNEGDLVKSEQHLLIADRLFENNFTTQLNLGIIYERKKQLDKAKQYYIKSIDIYPNQTASEKLATLFIVSGDWEYAEKVTIDGLERYPWSATLHLNRGLVFYKKDKDIKKSLTQVHRAYELSKDYEYLTIYSKIEKGENFNLAY